MVYISQNPIDNVIIGVAAIVLLVFVADKIIGKSVSISRKLGISPLFIGLTVISIGTSIPEITMHVVASLDILRGNIDPFIASGTVLGTNIGSSMVQQTLITGLVGLLAALHGRAIYMRKDFLRKDFLMVIAAASMLLLFSLDKNISRTEGAVLFFGYALYLWYLWIGENNKNKEKKKSSLDGDEKKTIAKDFLYVAAGLIALVFSAEYILRVAEFFVMHYGVGGSLIGILTIGIASALPEFTTSVSGILRGAYSISIGTLVGSNITNPMFALGLGAMISTYKVPRAIIEFDLPVKIITAVIIMAFLWKTSKLTKREAFVLIAMYIAYALIRIKYFAVDI